jgi:hypothetical protein
MSQRTLAFTSLLLKEISCNSLGKHRPLVVYVKQSSIQQSKHGLDKKRQTVRCSLSLG